MKWKLALFALFACSCAPVAAPPAYALPGEILPIQAQRVIDQATATARAMATQGAQATATRQARLEAAADAWTATAAAQSIVLTRDAATQRAAETATSGRWTQAAVVSAVTATAQAGELRATTQAREAEAMQQAQAQAGETERLWRAVPAAIVVLLAVVAFLAFREWQRGYRKRSEVEVLHRHIVETSLGPVVMLPGQPPLVLAGESALPNPDWRETGRATGENTREAHWQAAVLEFVRQGVMINSFAMRAMTGAEIVTDPGWRQITGLLKGAGVLAGGEARTVWAPGWNYIALQIDLNDGTLALPYPEGEPPQVKLAQNVGQHATPHTRTTANAFNAEAEGVEGVEGVEG